MAFLPAKTGPICHRRRAVSVGAARVGKVGGDRDRTGTVTTASTDNACGRRHRGRWFAAGSFQCLAKTERAGELFGARMSTRAARLTEIKALKGEWFTLNAARTTSRDARPERQDMRHRIAGVAAAAALVVLVPAWAWAQGPSYPDRYAYGPHMWWSGGWYGMIFGPLFMMLVLAAVVAAVILLVRWLGAPWHGTAPHPMPPGRTPLDILRERFARGEIDKQEFEERRRVLGD
jgi:putative membrane protein